MKILIPLKRTEQVKDVLRYVENIAEAGTKAVFLMPYPIDGIHRSTEKSEAAAVEHGKRLAEYYTWERNLENSRRILSPALEALSSKGMEVSVDVYTGRLTRAIKKFTANGDVHLIVTGAGLGQRIAAFLNGGNFGFGLSKRPASLPALLIQPRR